MAVILIAIVVIGGYSLNLALVATHPAASSSTMTTQSAASSAQNSVDLVRIYAQGLSPVTVTTGAQLQTAKEGKRRKNDGKGRAG